jgi:hypothetical protein
MRTYKNKKRCCKKHKRIRKSYSQNIKKGGSIKTIDNVAFLIPMHPKHYDMNYSLLNKLKNIMVTIDIYGIFSNKQDYELFKMKEMIKEIIPDNIPTDTNAIVIYKKLYGLKCMINTPYEYVILCDSEIDIVPENFTKENIITKIQDIFNNKVIYGIKVIREIARRTIRVCASVFAGDDYKKIESATDNFTLFSFWYNLPVYKREHLKDFLDKIKFDTLTITWDHFESLLYEYYLITNHNFKMIDITNMANNIGDGLYVENINRFSRLKELKFGFSSVLYKFWKLMPNELSKEKTFLLIHTNRE